MGQSRYRHGLTKLLKTLDILKTKDQVILEPILIPPKYRRQLFSRNIDYSKRG